MSSLQRQPSGAASEDTMRSSASTPTGADVAYDTISSSGSPVVGLSPRAPRRRTHDTKLPYYVPSYMLEPRVSEVCAVCGDCATGYHYRAMTCEGCKGFFRRTVQKKLTYTCKATHGCSVDKSSRNQCQQCRFDKCLSVGMATDLVLNPNQRMAKRKLIETNRNKRQRQTESTDILNDAERKLINKVSTAFETPGATCEKKCQDLMAPIIKRVVEFAKAIPGFEELMPADQMLLLKTACMEVMCLRISRRYRPESDDLLLSTGSVISRAAVNADEELKFMLEPMMEFARGLSRLELDSREYALLAALLLTQSDRTGLEKPELVDKLQDRVLAAFRHYLDERRGGDTIRWGNILMKVADLRSISGRYADRALTFKLEEPEKMPPLLVEVLLEPGDTLQPVRVSAFQAIRPSGSSSQRYASDQLPLYEGDHRPRAMSTLKPQPVHPISIPGLFAYGLGMNPTVVPPVGPFFPSAFMPMNLTPPAATTTELNRESISVKLEPRVGQTKYPTLTSTDQSKYHTLSSPDHPKYHTLTPAVKKDQDPPKYHTLTTASRLSHSVSNLIGR